MEVDQSKSKCLAYVGQISICLPSENTEKFFKDREGLTMGRFFPMLVLAPEALSLAYYELTQMAVDEEIERALPQSGIFARDEGFRCIKELITLQQCGNQGPLLTSTHANLFYLRVAPDTVLVVRVVWYQGAWHVDDWPFNAPQAWRKGERIFMLAAR